MRSTWESRACARHGVVTGSLLLLIGTVFLLKNLGLLSLAIFQTWWPLLLIVIGVARILALRGWAGPRKPYNDFGTP